MWQYNNSPVIYNNELYHYGKLGMKWGLRKSVYKESRIEPLSKKALNYDKKAAALYKKSEKVHATTDLDRSNKMAKKAAKYNIRSAKTAKKALKTDNEFVRTVLERKAAGLSLKATKAKLKANRISRMKGYGVKAAKIASKSDRATILAAKARKKIADNKRYIAMMNRKISTLSELDTERLYDSSAKYVDKYL